MPRKQDDPVVIDIETETPVPPARPPAGDARRDQKQQKRNREELGVDDAHKTPDMEKGHRGTFP